LFCYFSCSFLYPFFALQSWHFSCKIRQSFYFYFYFLSCPFVVLNASCTWIWEVFFYRYLIPLVYFPAPFPTPWILDYDPEFLEVVIIIVFSCCCCSIAIFPWPCLQSLILVLLLMMFLLCYFNFSYWVFHFHYFCFIFFFLQNLNFLTEFLLYVVEFFFQALNWLPCLIQLCVWIIFEVIIIFKSWLLNSIFGILTISVSLDSCIEELWAFGGI
jgi:hypothetical protein